MFRYFIDSWRAFMDLDVAVTNLSNRDDRHAHRRILRSLEHRSEWSRLEKCKSILSKLAE